MYDHLMVRYGELGLKGDNRGYFKSALNNNIKKAVETAGSGLSIKDNRILLTPGLKMEDTIQLLQRVFGLVSLSPVITVASDLDAIYQAAQSIIYAKQPRSFKIETRRANKSFPLDSMQVSREIGGRILEHSPEIRVDVHNPELTVYIEIRADNSYIYDEILPCGGGLPVGTSGRAMLLLSGGIDSPVAGWMAMKRGIKISAVHFYSYPFTREPAKQKVIELARVLAEYNNDLELHIVNIGEIQETISKVCPNKFRITILRRMMVRLAEQLASKTGDQVLISGESVGQVASQTLESMIAIGQATDMVILKPLCGLDKTEITVKARQIGTYDISALPFEDCCSMFVPAHPVTKPTLTQVLEAENTYNWTQLLQEAINDVETLHLKAQYNPCSGNKRAYQGLYSMRS